MINMPDIFAFGRRQPPADARIRAINETSAFLTWALKRERNLPRIPARRVDQGGFTDLLNRPGTRAMATRYWAKALNWEDEF